MINRTETLERVRPDEVMPAFSRCERGIKMGRVASRSLDACLPERLGEAFGLGSTLRLPYAFRSCSPLGESRSTGRAKSIRKWAFDRIVIASTALASAMKSVESLTEDPPRQTSAPFNMKTVLRGKEIGNLRI